jgi:hypothetical protein
MTNIICWICKNNLPYKEYDGDKLLDEDGSKACFDCLLEDGAFEEEEQNE